MREKLMDPTPPHLHTVSMDRGAPTQCPPGTATPLPIQLAGDYELMDTLGHGGMGVVYLARQCGLKRKVAYKMLTQVGTIDPTALERFRSEAETLGRMQHSGIVQVFDSGTERGRPFLVMEYVAGGNLADRLRVGRMDHLEAARIIAAVAEAVGHAHQHGIIHRDLKPANILLTPEGQPKVADFGLARDLSSEHLTRTGLIAGTPTYMPPEQLTGEKDLTPATDVWAMGVVLYELLSGTVPFSGADPQQILTNILRHEAVSLRDWQPHLPHDLDTICAKCLQKEPHRRYADGTELAADLRRFLENMPILARPIGRSEKTLRWCRRNPAIAGSLLVTAVALLSATGVSLLFAKRANTERANAIDAAINEQALRELAEKAVIAEREAREVAEKAVASEKSARQDAEKAANAEKLAREAAEKAVSAEKQARKEAEALAGMMEQLLVGLRPLQGINLAEQFMANLDSTAKSLEVANGDPLVRARLLWVIASTYQAMGHYPPMIRLMEKSLELREKHLPPGDPLLRHTKLDLGYKYVHDPSRAKDALRLIKPAIEEELAKLPPDSLDAVPHLGMLRIAYNAVGNEEEELKLADRCIELCRKHYGEEHPETYWMLVNHPKFKTPGQNIEVSIPIFQKAMKVFLDSPGYGKTCIPFIWSRFVLGLHLYHAGRAREAVPYFQDAFESHQVAQRLKHPHVQRDRNWLLKSYETAGMYGEELPLRWTYFLEANEAGDWGNLFSHGWRCVRDCFWRYR